MIECEDDVDWEVLFWMQNMEKFDVCPWCEALKLQKPPQNQYWQIFCESCDLIITRFPPMSIGEKEFEEETQYVLGEHIWNEEEFERAKKLKAMV